MTVKTIKGAEVAVITQDLVERKIHFTRGHKVMLDSDLAGLYGVPTKVFNQAVGRNLERFPHDFRFQLTRDEFDNLRSQNCDLKWEKLRRSTVPAVCLY